MLATAQPKPPVVWIVRLEMSQAEVDAWRAFAYRLRDGVVTTGVAPEFTASLNNTFSPLYDALDAAAEGYAEG